MPSEQIVLEMADGKCDVYVSRPSGAGPWPAVIVYVDGMGVRPSIREIADRIAAQGYYTVLPDLFYRTPGQMPSPAAFFSDPAVRAEWQKNVVPTVTPANIMADTAKLLKHLETQPDVRKGPVGITGYCMGGRLSVYAAGHFGERVAAAGAFHPGGLATDAPESPHKLAPEIAARVYIGGAMEDRSFDEAQQERLRAALDAAGVDYTLEIYPAKHGWVPRDTPVHDPAQAERHFTKVFELFRATLGAAAPG